MNNKTEKHSTIGSGGGMKTKWREKKISRKRRGIAVLTLAALFFWYLPQIQVSRQIRKEQEEAVERYVREEKEENKEENEKSEEVQEQEPGSTDQNLFRLRTGRITHII